MRTPARALSAAMMTFALLCAGTAAAMPASANAGADAEIAIGPNGTSSTAAATIVLGASNGDGTRSVAFACAGASTGDVASTAVRSCTLRVNGITVQSAQPIALPGPSAASGGVRLRVPLGASVQACASVSSVFIVSPPLSSFKCAGAIVFST